MRPAVKVSHAPYLEEAAINDIRHSTWVVQRRVHEIENLLVLGGAGEWSFR